MSITVNVHAVGDTVTCVLLARAEQVEVLGDELFGRFTGIRLHDLFAPQDTIDQRHSGGWGVSGQVGRTVL